MDKRTNPGPYLRVPARADVHATYEVGYYDSNRGYLDVVHDGDAARACADFRYREATSVLHS